MICPSVSVIIPTYNRSDCLVRAIDSVLKQSLAPKEIIVVDDGSDEDVRGRLPSSVGRRVIVLRNETNLGAARSRNLGALHASGEYLAFLDSDDYWAADKLGKQMDLVKRHPAVRLVYCDQWIVRDGRLMESGKELLGKERLRERLMRGWTAPNTSTLLLHKGFFEDLGGFDAGLASCQDHDLWFRVARTSVDIAFVDERLSFFTTDAPNRLSLDERRRMAGTRRFLSKWLVSISEEIGRKASREFEHSYLLKTAGPILIDRIARRRWVSAARVFVDHLMFNPLLYRRLLHTRLWDYTPPPWPRAS